MYLIKKMTTPSDSTHRFDWKHVAMVGVPIIGGLITYYLWKKEIFGEREQITQSDCRIELIVPGDKIGAVIGRGGSVVREIEQTSGARVKVIAPPIKKFAPNEKVETIEEELDGTVIIEGSSENVESADIAVRKIIANTPPVMTAMVHIPKSAIGMVIGKGGANIRELYFVSGAKTSIGKTGNDMEEVIIKGRPQAIDAAKMWLEKKVKESEDLRERWNSPKSGTKKMKMEEIKNEPVVVEDESIQNQGDQSFNDDGADDDLITL